MPGTGHAKRAMPDARGQEHWPADGGGVGANATGEDQARFGTAETLRLKRAVRALQRNVKRTLEET